MGVRDKKVKNIIVHFIPTVFQVRCKLDLYDESIQR